MDGGRARVDADRLPAGVDRHAFLALADDRRDHEERLLEAVADRRLVARVHHAVGTRLQLGEHAGGDRQLVGAGARARDPVDREAAVGERGLGGLRAARRPRRCTARARRRSPARACSAPRTPAARRSGRRTDRPRARPGRRRRAARRPSGAGRRRRPRAPAARARARGPRRRGRAAAPGRRPRRRASPAPPARRTGPPPPARTGWSRSTSGTPGLHQPLGVVERRGRDTRRAESDLPLRDPRAAMRLGVRAQLHPGGRAPVGHPSQVAVERVEVEHQLHRTELRSERATQPIG